MNFPYGISDFRKLVTKDYFYCDRTDRIPLLEKGEFQLFLRPRRFGKSLLLSMLRNYYDIVKKDQFDEIFGNLKIAENPTSLHNQYLILNWDFSCIDPTGTADDIKRALHDHINDRIKAFIKYYKDYLLNDININPNNALSTIDSLISSVRTTSYPIYLLIDEYDNFANEVMMDVQTQDIYKALVYEKGPLKTLFKAVKASTSDSVFDRIFITGVSPVVMSDITSGYNIAKNIYLKPYFNDLCGFLEHEIESPLKIIAEECDLKQDNIDKAIKLMKTYYNGYIFALNAKKHVYNPTLAIYFMENLYESCKYPREMLDDNLATDEEKLRYVSCIPQGRQILLDLMKPNHDLVVTKLASRFGIKQMLTEKLDYTFLVSFLYYFGVLTIKDETRLGKLRLTVPNLVIQGLYVERIQQMLLPEPIDRDEGVLAAEQLYSYGDMQPLCDFIEQRYFKVFHNPDYKWANELTVKTAFLTLLYNDILYIMDSEKEAGRGYTDLTMIIRPDMRRFEIFDVLIEFKYIKLGDADLTGEKARKLSQQDLKNIGIMKFNMDKAKKQVTQYGNALKKKYKNLRLRKYAVVSLGFERLWWEEV
ncbi:AAA ATPase-like domain-containing protein [Candidatus Magnetomoraceae bacterium gMMP-15]